MTHLPANCHDDREFGRFLTSQKRDAHRPLSDDVHRDFQRVVDIPSGSYLNASSKTPFTKGIINRLRELVDWKCEWRPSDAVLRDGVDLPLNRRASPLLRMTPFFFESRLAFIDYLHELS